MADITSPRWLYIKGILFGVLGILASALLLLESPTVRTVLLLGIAIWSFCRLYFFAFYVIEHYIDPGFRFAGIFDFLKYAIRKRRSRRATTETTINSGVNQGETS